MATIMENNSAFTTRVLFNLNDLGFNKDYYYNNNTTISEKYICVRKSKSVVIIDMTKPKQPIRISITADYPAIMNPDTPILAYKFQAKIDGTTQDQLKIVDVEANTTLKSYTTAEKVEYLKWTTPKLLALVTQKAIYHWSIEGSTGPVKMFDMTEEFTTHKNLAIRDYMHDPSDKWFAFIGEWEDPTGFRIIDLITNWLLETIRILKNRVVRFIKKIGSNCIMQTRLFVRPYQGTDQKFSIPAHVAAFINLNVEENHTTSTRFCCALYTKYKGIRDTLELSVYDALVPKPGEPDFGNTIGNKKSTIYSGSAVALKISQKYGLIYVITYRGQIFIHDLDTVQAICSYNVSGHEIFRTIEGPSSGSFYSISKDGQVLLTSVNDFTILSFLLLTRGKLYDLNKLHHEISNENEELKKQKVDFRDESAKIKGYLEESHSKMGETGKELYIMGTEIINNRMSENKMLNEIEHLKMQIVEEQIKKDNIITKLENSLQEEIRKREKIEEQFANLRIKTLNEIEELKTENAKLLNERDKLQTETKLQREIDQQLTSKITDSYQISKNEMSNRIVRLTMLNTELTRHNTELTKEKDKMKENLSKSLQVEQDVRTETGQQLKIKEIEIYNYQKSQEEVMEKIEDFWLIKESTNLKVNFTEYSHAELRKVTNEFNESLKIGQGGYGPVYKALIGLTPVAIKILEYEDSHGKQQFQQEVEILRRVKHRNLVMLLGACHETQALVYELIPNGSLYDVLRNKQTPNALTSKKRICIASDICSALICLLSAKPHGIVHGDLKPSNILMDSNYMGKLSDFGICRYLEKTSTRNTAHYQTNTLRGTFPYMDQEYINLGEMTVQYDVYAFGIILLELVTGRGPRGLRDHVEEALIKGEILVDASAGEWPLDEAKRMVRLGLWCSEHSRKNRPNLAKEVCPEIESMLRASLHF